MATARQRKRLTAEERLKRMIDRWNVLDAVVKNSDKERKLLTTKLRNIVKASGRRGVFHGNHSLIRASDHERRIVNQEKVLELVGEKKFPKCFKKIKFIMIQGGSLSSPPQPRPDDAEDEEG